MLGSGLDRGDSRVGEETTTHTEQDLGGDQTANLTIVSTSESNKETESQGVGDGSKDNEGFESSDLHDDETEQHTGGGGAEREDVGDSLSSDRVLAESDNEHRVQEGTLNRPGWRRSQLCTS